jgi:hypothetical protein
MVTVSELTCGDGEVFDSSNGTPFLGVLPDSYRWQFGRLWLRMRKSMKNSYRAASVKSSKLATSRRRGLLLDRRDAQLGGGESVVDGIANCITRICLLTPHSV